MAKSIDVRNITKRFGNTLALDNVSVSVPSGSVYCVAGPNGSGKTTMLDVLTGTVSSDGGEIKITGRVGYCHQNPMLYEDLSVSQNIEVFSEILSVKKSSAQSTLDLLGLEEFSNKRVSNLSSGTKKRVELCVSMISDPEVLMLDEPITGLDKKSEDEVLKFIRSIKGKKTVVISTHKLRELEGICDHLLVLNFGRKELEKQDVKEIESTYKKIIKGGA